MSTKEMTSSSSETFLDLKNKRGFVRQKLTKRCNSIKNQIDSLDYEDCLLHIEALKTLSKKLSDFDDDIGPMIFSLNDENQMNKEDEETGSYENTVNLVSNMLKSKLSQFSTGYGEINNSSVQNPSDERAPQERLTKLHHST